MEPPPDPAEASAIVCELLNDYARTLRSTAAFPEVRTGADIRRFCHGWRLEKWVEAQLNPEEGHWACWWIELGASGGHWLIDAHLSISHHPPKFKESPPSLILPLLKSAWLNFTPPRLLTTPDQP